MNSGLRNPLGPCGVFRDVRRSCLDSPPAPGSCSQALSGREELEPGELLRSALH